MAKRRKMLAFKINELSGVDRPAQEPATVALLKRREDPEEVFKSLDGDFALTNAVDGHSHLLPMAAGQAGNTSYQTADGQEFGHTHPFVIDAQGKITIGEASGHTHRVARTTKADDGETPMKTEKSDGKTVDYSAELEKVNKANAELSEILKMSAEHRAHFDTLQGEAREDFLTAPVTKRDEVIANLTAADPVVFKSADGTEYRKSDGALLIKMAKERDEDRKELAKARAEAMNASLAKRAEDDLGNLPGESTVKCEVLRALDGISDEATRKGAFEMLKAADTAMSGNFQREGTALNKNTGENASAELENLSKRHAKEHDVSIQQARIEVLGTPEGERLYAQSHSN